MLCLYLLGQSCLHLTFLPYLGSETYSCKYDKLPNIVIYACKNIKEKKEFVENVLPANSALFIYISTHCVKKVKRQSLISVDSVVQYLTHPLWPWVQEVPGSIPSSSKDFYVCFLFCCCVFTFCPETHFCHKNLQCLWQWAIS